ncbi:HTH-type transcriptional repressor YtrA [Oxobacter pfennigii]|uniref:HTH-type transcriptional repressor YtrA n=1 Tax=Oxobacter pfennigii TaxID=36849 RepID=A0A0P8W1P6_9CLOT|nr:GntR family transcriptional regulator [Oxobacter pfennigii]KPU42379.1 HTH-type transcriptional repressor YtrA [Oxobacter pfennigii]
MISIDYRDKRPIYEQLIEGIEDMAIRGILEPDSQLISVRQLALELSINPNTIQRAYAELEKKGIIYSIKGRGSFVSGNLEKLRTERKQLIFKEFDYILGRAVKEGIQKHELLEFCQKYFDGQKEGIE